MPTAWPRKAVISPAMHIPELSAHLNRSRAVKAKYCFKVAAFVLGNHGSIYILQQKLSEPRNQSRNLTINHLKIKRVYNLSATHRPDGSRALKVWLPIWFVFLAVLIAKLHCWCTGFLRAGLVALMNKSQQADRKICELFVGWGGAEKRGVSLRKLKQWMTDKSQRGKNRERRGSRV